MTENDRKDGFFEFLLQQRDFFMCLKRYFFVFIVTVGTQLCSGSSVDRWVIESFFNKQDVPVDSVEDVKEMLNYFASQQEQGNQQVIEEIEVHLIVFGLMILLYVRCSGCLGRKKEGLAHSELHLIYFKISWDFLKVHV